MTTDLAIKDVAERTGIAAGTIRMWEQRYGFPVPDRTPSGYRRYTEDDVETLRKVLALRHRGLSVPAAISRAQDTGGPSDHPSIYAAVAAHDVGARPHVLKKSTLVALIPRFYDPASGVVAIDGNDIREFTIRSVRRQTAFVVCTIPSP